MGWTLELSELARKNLRQLDPPDVRRVLRFLDEPVARAADPRLLDQGLKGSELGQFWRYRVGDYRIIAAIDDQRVTVLVVRIGHRGDVYRRT